MKRRAKLLPGIGGQTSILVAEPTRAHRKREERQDIVIDRSKTQHSSGRLSALLVMLGMCVFLWGLGYKLSLYDVHRPSNHRIPEAKLLSRDEDQNATESAALCLSKIPQYSEFVLIAGLIAAWLGTKESNRELATHYLEVELPASSRLQASLTAHFFRPPPIL
jgi:hypothetical protein